MANEPMRSIHDAVEELKRHPEKAVEAEVDGVVVEMRLRRGMTAAEFFRTLGTWKTSKTPAELHQEFEEEREAGGSREIPGF